MGRKGRTSVARGEEQAENGTDANGDAAERRRRSSGRPSKSKGQREHSDDEGASSGSEAFDEVKKRQSSPRKQSKPNYGEDAGSSDEDSEIDEKKKTTKRTASRNSKTISNKSDDSEDEDKKKNKKTKGRGRPPKKAPLTESDKEDKEDNESEDDEKKTSKKRNTSRNSKNISNKSEDSEDEDTDNKKRKTPTIRGRSPKKAKLTGSDKEDEEEEEYEVEKVIGEKDIRGVKHYLIRWKGYNSDSDTWEPHNTVDCPNLIALFKKQHKKTKGRPRTKSKTEDAPQESWDENEDFEVEKILDVHFRRDGTREFLVVWKGYPSSQSTWEPEANMDCVDLISKFMEKVERAKESNEKVLRVNRKHTDRFTLSMGQIGRRLSKRQFGKQRVQYHDAE